MWTIIFYLIVCIHHIFCAGNLLSIFVLPFVEPWYVSIPLLSFLLNLFLNDSFKLCPLTRIENNIRLAINKPTISSFVGHYYIKNYFRFRRYVNRGKKNLK
jgi:hypothetical protein